MKRIIYTAVALIICASVFGIADYFNARKHGALVNYTDDVATTETVTEKKTEKISEVKEPAATKKEIIKTAVSPKKITKAKVKELHSDGIKNEVVIEDPKEPIAEKVDPITAVLESKVTDGDNDSTIVKENKRTINMEMFSRAPIRNKKLKKN